MNDDIQKAFTQLVAPGATANFAVTWMQNHVFQYTIANIDTDVAVRAEGSLDGTNFFNLDVTSLNTTKNANGTYYMFLTGVPLKTIRFQFVSESGGTAATIDVVYAGSLV